VRSYVHGTTGCTHAFARLGALRAPMPVDTRPACCFTKYTVYANYTEQSRDHNEGIFYTYWDAGGANFGSMKKGNKPVVAPDQGRDMFPVPARWEIGYERHCTGKEDCCHEMERYLRVTGIPKGTPRVPAEEERAILERWKGEWQVVFDATLANKAVNLTDIYGKQQFCGAYTLAFEHAHFNSDMLRLSGGYHLNESREDSSDSQSAIVTHKDRNYPWRARLSLWRGVDGTLYIDNIGSKVVSESPTELKVKNAGNREWIFRRAAGYVVPPATMAMLRDGPPRAKVEADVAKLVALKQSGALSEVEFEAAKKLAEGGGSHNL
jgi:hypothetical protein